MRVDKQAEHANEKVKAVLFMVFHIEGNSKWAYKFNSKMLKCHERLENQPR